MRFLKLEAYSLFSFDRSSLLSRRPISNLLPLLYSLIFPMCEDEQDNNTFDAYYVLAHDDRGPLPLTHLLRTFTCQA